MDATYRADLRDFNELDFARFDAKLGERIGEGGWNLAEGNRGGSPQRTATAISPQTTIRPSA